MKSNINVILLILIIFPSIGVAQGWILEVEVDINHSLCAQERLDAASVYYNGTWKTGSDPGSRTYVSFEGTDTITSNFVVSANGTCLESYYPEDNVTTFSASYSRRYKAGIDFFSMFYSSQSEPSSVGGLITYYPRMIITGQAASCNLVTLNAYQNSGGYGFHWEVADHFEGPWTSISGRNTATISITPSELAALGLSSAYGDKYFRVTGKHGTTSLIEKVQVYYPGPAATFQIASPKCHNEADGSVLANIVSPLQGEITNFVFQLFRGEIAPANIQGQEFGGNEINISGLTAGSYWARVQNNSNADVYGDCYTDHIVVINNPAKVTIAALTSPLSNGYHISCHAGTDGTITATPSGGTGSYREFLWSPTISTGPEAINVPVGTYNVRAKDSNNCISDVASITLSQPDPLRAALSSTGGRGEFEISCPGEDDGAVAAVTTGGVPILSYTWSTGETGATISGLTAGSYSVEVSDVNHCKATAEITLEEPDPISFEISEVSAISCAGKEDGALEVRNIRGTIGSAISFLWSTGNTTSMISALSGGTYSLTVTDQQGCSAVRNRQLASPSAPLVSITPASDYNGSIISCDQGSDGILTANVISPDQGAINISSYAWQRNGTVFETGSAKKIVENLSAGDYKVLVTYGNNCQAESAFRLRSPSPIAPVITTTSDYHGSAISCPGASDGRLQATASGGTTNGAGYLYMWSSGESGPSIAGKSKGTYEVVATDINGCTGKKTSTLDEPATIEPKILVLSDFNGLPLSCHGASDAKLDVTSTGGTGNVEYSWNTGVSGQHLDRLSSGDYTVISRDQNGCQVSKSTTIVNPPAVTLTISVMSDFNGTPISCHGKSDGWCRAIALGGTGSYDYFWSTGISDRDLTNAPSGEFVAKVVDSNGCSATASITIDSPAPLVADIVEHSDFNGYGVRCSGSADGFLEARASGGTQPFRFYWPENAETDSKNSNLAAAMYSVIVSDINGCTDSVSYQITEPDAVQLAAVSVENVPCFEGKDGVVILSPAGGVGAYEFSINGVSWHEEPKFTSLEAGSYDFTVRDANGCEAQIDVAVNQPDEIVVELETQPAFCNDPRGAAYATITGGREPYQYHWRNVAGDSLSVSAFIENIPSGIYTLTVTDNFGCQATRNAGITATDGPQVEVKALIAAKCSYSADGTATINVVQGDGPFNYSWSDGQTLPTATALRAGNYFVATIDHNLCSTVTEVVITAPDKLEARPATVTMPTCFGECNGSIEMKAVGGTAPYRFHWPKQSGPQVQNLCAGSYRVEVRDLNDCFTEHNIELNEPEPLEVRLAHRVLPRCNKACDGQISVETTGGAGGYLYAWSTGGTSELVNGLCTGEHLINVTDKNNCSTTKALNLGEPAPVLIDLRMRRDPVCHDGCDGSLEVGATGGSGRLEYSWDSGPTESIIKGLCAGTYSVTVTDEHSCKNTAAFTLANPDGLELDLGRDTTLCEGQSHRLDAGPMWASYFWNSNAGVTGSTSSILISRPGLYWIEAKTFEGCIARDSILLETSTELLVASFLMPKETVVGDTIAIIDISWPLPETITWMLPSSMKKVMDMGDVLWGQFSDPGIYTVGLRAQLEKCHDHVDKTIIVLKEKTGSLTGRLQTDNVSEFGLFPNPTNGVFDVIVKLKEPAPVTMSAWNSGTGLMIASLTDSGKSEYRWHVDLTPVSPGIYILRLDHSMGRKYLRFVVR